MVHPQTTFFFSLFLRKDVISDETKKKEKKNKKNVRGYADAVWSFQWFSVNFLHFFLFKGANTACRKCDGLRSRLCQLKRLSFIAALRTAREDATPERSAAKPRDCVHFLCLHYRVLSILYVFTCACVYDVHSLL